jgi:hypothetical protein
MYFRNGRPKFRANGGAATDLATGDSNGAATLAAPEPYDATGWSGDTAPPQKAAVRDQFEALLPAGVLSATSRLPAAARIRTFGITIDGAGSAITTGVKGYTRVPYACTINKVSLIADQSGSLVVDVWKDSFANYPPTDADSITASAPPTLSSAIKAEDTTLTGWTTSVTAGDTIGFNVDSASTVTRAHLIVECQI